MTIREITEVLSQIKYLDWTFEVSADAADAWWLRVSFTAPDARTGADASWNGRKWLISKHATKSELVHTAMKAVLTAVEHEAREAFTYKGRQVFGPHFDVDFLAAYCDLLYTQDARPAMPAEAVA